MGSQSADQVRLRLIQQLLTLPPGPLSEAERFFARLGPKVSAGNLPEERPAQLSVQRDWPHAPLHRVSEQGTYIVTGSTYEKAHYFRGADRLDYLEATLLSLAKEFAWQLEAWAVFSNHYHFVGHSPPDPSGLPAFVKELHGRTAR
jgi:hypothetical protein